jgi:outer membrane protein OmpA-like peptidoglycan-associated protein
MMPLFLATSLLLGTATAMAEGVLSSDELIEKLDIQNEPRTRGLVKTTGARVMDHTATSPAPSAPAPSVVLNIPFAYNSSQLSDSAILQLDELGKALNSDILGNYAFEIAGHTDATGSAAYNRDLSIRRAEAVKHYLNARLGVDNDRLSTIGWGEDKPIRSENPEHPDNRRVEVINLGYTQQ